LDNKPNSLGGRRDSKWDEGRLKAPQLPVGRKAPDLSSISCNLFLVTTGLEEPESLPIREGEFL